MKKEMLETINQRLDRLEKIVAGLNQKLSADFEMPNNNQDDNIGSKVIEKILERMGYPPDFKPRPLKEVRKSMVESGIRPEDNEFSREIIAEREK